MVEAHREPVAAQQVLEVLGSGAADAENPPAGVADPPVLEVGRAVMMSSQVC